MNQPLVFHVTGAAGFVGRHVCDQLIRAGHQVRAVIRSTDDELERYGVQLWRGDLWDENVLREAITGVNVVIHCAGNARFGNGPHYKRENVELTEYLLSMTERHAKGARFIYVSTIGAIDRPVADPCSSPLNEKSPPFPSSDYGKSKLQAEELVRKSSLATSIIRPTMVVGSDMRSDSHFSVFARHSLTGSLVARLNWPGRFSVIHVKDLASAILVVSIDERAIGETYFCAGDSVSVGDFLVQCNPSVTRLPLGFVSGVAKLSVRWLPFSLKAMLLPALTATDEKLRRLGWQPGHTARSALAEVLQREICRMDPGASPGGQTVITGAASGLGRALAVRLSPQRDRLLLVDKNQPALEELASKLGNAKISVVDLADPGEIDRLLASPEWQESNVTELYACAGIGLRGRMQDISIIDHRKTIYINVLSRIVLGKAAISGMQKRHFGRVVLISSSSAFQALPYMATYAGSNSALLSIGEAWGFETAGDGIQVMTVCPGGMQTNFQKSGGVKEVEGEKLMLPETVAEKILTGLRHQQGTLIVSSRSFAMSMLARALPRSWSVKLWGSLMEKMR
jgi:hypothetical protein